MSQNSDNNLFIQSLWQWRTNTEAELMGTFSRDVQFLSAVEWKCEGFWHGVYSVKWNEVSRQIYDTLTQLACMLAMLQSGIHVWLELCYKKHRKSNKITKKKLI